MTTRVIIAAGDQGLAQQVQTSLLEMEDVEIAFIATSGGELSDAVLRDTADVVLVHEELGPEPVLQLLADLTLRRPACAMLIVAKEPDAQLVTAAMDAGARGLVTLPLSFEQAQGRIAAAAEFSTRMRRAMGAGGGQGIDEGGGGRARVIALAGSKGGVGVTTLVSHLGLDLARTLPGLQICLLDLDLEKGDVPGVLEVRHRLGVSDLAKVANDLSSVAIADAVTRHDSGVDLLLAPLDIRDVEAVTPRALRQVMSGLRSEYDVLLVDLGSHVTPAQATVIELADEIVLVVTPDVVSMRGMRRTINAWESLGVTKESEVRVLVNRTSRQTTVSMETVRQLTKAPVLATGIPASFRRLEPALNARDPLQLAYAGWWSTLRQVGREIGMVPSRYATGSGRRAAVATAAATAEPVPREQQASPRRARRSRTRDDRGSMALESIALIPVFAALVAIVFHIAVYATAATLHATATSAAARAASIGESPQAAAEDSLPSFLADDVSASGSGGGVTVTLDISYAVSVPGLPTRLTADRSVVREP